MLQQKIPEDFVIATGRMITVRNFIEIAAKILGWGNKNNPNGIIWKGEGINEVGIRADTNEEVIKVDSRYFRPTEVDQLLGDPSNAREKLGWVPKISLEEMVKEMINNDMEEAKNQILIKQNKDLKP